MQDYQVMSKAELENEYKSLCAAYAAVKDKKLDINMQRGKPSAEQLDLALPMLDCLNADSHYITENGIDCRNYGEIAGTIEARKLFSEYLGVSVDEIIITGDSSTGFLFNCLCRAMLAGVLESEKPWARYEKPKVICFVPGYDRHFNMLKMIGIEVIPVQLNEDGPDMETVERLVSQDETIKGMICVPKYSNPLGCIYSDENVRRIANLRPKAKDFRVFWDNAYAVHYVYEDVPLLNIMDECKAAGTENMLFIYGSTSKITFPSSGVSYFAASKENIVFTLKQVGQYLSGYNKMNMLMHTNFLKNMDGIRAIMDKHAAILRRHFDAVLNAFDRELLPRKVGTWVRPKGGYFVTYIAEKGCAKRIVALSKEAGVQLTPAGSTHPGLNDPDDAYIRVAPSNTTVEELNAAMEVFCIAARLATVEKLLHRTAEE